MYSQDEAQHWNHVREVLRILKKAIIHFSGREGYFGKRSHKLMV
jgi:hypothetical protein